MQLQFRQEFALSKIIHFVTHSIIFNCCYLALPFQVSHSKLQELLSAPFGDIFLVYIIWPLPTPWWPPRQQFMQTLVEVSRHVMYSLHDNCRYRYPLLYEPCNNQILSSCIFKLNKEFWVLSPESWTVFLCARLSICLLVRHSMPLSNAQDDPT